jgi:broad specificity phosphatase PhoE
MIGNSDYPLSRLGQKQIETQSLFLQKLKFELILTSPLKRALETAEIISGKFYLTPLVVDDFREINLGLFEGLTSEEAKTRYPVVWEARGRDLVNVAPPKGESYAQLSTRVLSALESVLSDYKTANQILIVAHQAVIQVIMARTLGCSLMAAINNKIKLASVVNLLI